MNFPLAVMDKLLPGATDESDHTLLSSFRLLVSMICVSVASAAMLALFALDRIDPIIRLVMLAANLGLFFILVAIRSGLPLKIASNTFLGIMAASFLLTTALTGDRPTSSVYSIALVPIFALILLGVRSMVLWACASLVSIATVLVLVSNPLLNYAQTELDAQRLGGFVWFIGFALALWLCTEAVRRSTMAQLVEAKEELKAQKNQLRQVLDLVPHFIYVKDRDGRLLLVNKVLAEVCGLTVEQAVGRLHGELHHDTAEAAMMLEDDRSVIESGIPIFNKKENVKGEKGAVRTFETTKIPYTPIGSETAAIMGVSIDITERTKAEQRMHRAEHLASIGTLSAGIAHQINNPVGAIMVAAEYGAMMLEKGASPEETRTYFEDIISEARRCGKIVRDVLSFSRTEHTEKVSENLARTCKLVDSYAHDLSVELHNDTSETEIFALVSTIEIEQVVVNVLRNGIESGADRVSIKCSTQPHTAVIVIRDNGTGIPNQQLTKIFDPFYTTRLGQGGSGLGLSVVQGIVKAHDGRIEVASSEDGSQFSIYLPLAPAIRYSSPQGENHD